MEVVYGTRTNLVNQYTIGTDTTYKTIMIEEIVLMCIDFLKTILGPG